MTDVREKTLRLLHGIDCRESILRIDFPKTRPFMFRAILSIGLITCVLAGSARADGPYDSLLKYVPSNTNVIALIDIKGAFASPLAKKENWLEKGQPNNRGGLGFLPAEADTVVIASDINFNKLTRQFQVGLVKLRKNVPGMNEFATREGGKLPAGPLSSRPATCTTCPCPLPNWQQCIRPTAKTRRGGFAPPGRPKAQRSRLT
jgi:hypothetical protein